MATSLIEHERIVTTTAKAKTLRPYVEKLITKAKGGTLHHRRLAHRIVRTQPMMVKLFGILGPRYQFRPGGYTRILKLSGRRKGDAADMSVIEFVDRKGELRPAAHVGPEHDPRISRGAQKLLDTYHNAKAKGEKIRHPGLHWLF